MKKELLKYLICPKTKKQLNLVCYKNSEADEINEGILVTDVRTEYKIFSGIPDMIYDEVFVGDSVFARNYYTKISNTYDEDVRVTFDLYNDTNEQVREYMINLLNLNHNDKILEISAGTGEDSKRILDKIGKEGRLTLLDITPAMLLKAKEKLTEDKRVHFVSGTAVSLPFADNTFDKLYCFTGVGHFPDIKSALKEMARVVKVGGKVVFSEKNVPLWLRNTEYGKICVNNNPMFANDVPLAHIPVEARNLGIRWILGNVHYVIDYCVGDGEPKGNFDLKLPGMRGGSFNSRYYGKLEGVSNETKKLSMKAIEKLFSKNGTSMYQWLDDLIKRESIKVLEEFDEMD